MPARDGSALERKWPEGLSIHQLAGNSFGSTMMGAAGRVMGLWPSIPTWDCGMAVEGEMEGGGTSGLKETHALRRTFP